MMPIQQSSDATICSNASSSYGQTSSVNNTKQGTKVKAYVDFSNFNKNYEEYLEKNGQKASQEKSKDSEDSNLEKSNSNSNSSQSTEDWVVLN